MGMGGSYRRPHLCSGGGPSGDHRARSGRWPQYRGEHHLSSRHTGGTRSSPGPARDTWRKSSTGSQQSGLTIMNGLAVKDDEPFLWEMLFYAAHLEETGETSLEAAKKLYDLFPLLYPLLLALSTCPDKISQQSPSFTQRFSFSVLKIHSVL